jgi:hypothetical protein
VVGTPPGWAWLNFKEPAVLKDLAAAKAFWVIPEPPDRKLITEARPLVTDTMMVLEIDPGGATPNSTSATDEPLCTPPTEVAEATKSGRTEAT